MKKISLLLVLSFMCLLSFAYNADEGKTIFTTRCNSCHAIDKNIVGPALMNVDKRHNEKWIIAFVHSSQTVIKSGDTAAINLFSRFNSITMPDHPDLTDEQIRNLLSYIKEQSKVAASSPKTNPSDIYKETPKYFPVNLNNYTFWFSLFSVVGLLVWVLLLRVRVESLK